MVTNVTDEVPTRLIILSQQGKGKTNHAQETATEMKSTRNVEFLISQQWPKLKQKALNENDPDKLIAIIEEIDDLLFILEMRIVGPKFENRCSSNEGNSKSDRLESVSPNLEIGGQ
jgi:hypothetical protein